MSRKWDSLPNEILAQIIQAVGSELDIKEEAKKTKWITVNKQWYDWYQSIKYKQVSLRLCLSNRLFNNVIFSKFQPGKWIRSMTFQQDIMAHSCCTKSSGFDNDALQTLITNCPHVRYVSLPGYLGGPDYDQDWTYFITALKATNTWKLHTISVGGDGFKGSGVYNMAAKRNYFDCAVLMKNSIRSIHLTEGMALDIFTCIREFEKLSTLTVGRYVVDTLEKCCELVDNTPQLEEMTVYFPSERRVENIASLSLSSDDDDDDDDNDHPMQEIEQTAPSLTKDNNNNTSGDSKTADEVPQATTSNKPAPPLASTLVTTFPRVKRLQLVDYNAPRILNDFMHLKRFSMLTQLEISFQHIDYTKIHMYDLMVKKEMLAYIHSTVPNYEIRYETSGGSNNNVSDLGLEGYLEIYCKGMEKLLQNRVSSIDNFCLHIVLQDDDQEDSSFRSDKPIVFKRGTASEQYLVDNNNAYDGEITLNTFYDVDTTDTFTIISNIKRLLRLHNDVITEIKLDLQEYIGDTEDESLEIGQYIAGVNNFTRCIKLHVYSGHFEMTPIEIVHGGGDMDDLTRQQHNNSSITHIQFENSMIDPSQLSFISNYYPNLDCIEFTSCSFNNIPDDLPFITDIQLPRTRINQRLCFYQDEKIPIKDEGLVLYPNNSKTIMLISVTSEEQDFEKGFICTSCAKQSLVEEVQVDLLDAVRDISDLITVAFVKVYVLFIKELSFKIVDKKDQKKEEIIFDFRITFPDRS